MARTDSFDITHAVRAICVSMCDRLDDLSHIDMSQVGVGFCQARKNVAHGIQASLTPLRFENGTTTKTVRRRRYACQRITMPDGRECLYLLNVYLPRFQNLVYREKLLTIVHELWHISPEFDGDIRRHEGRCHVHGPSQAAFDAHSQQIAERWLATSPAPELHAWLHDDFGALRNRTGGIVGTRYPVPKLVPLPDAT